MTEPSDHPDTIPTALNEAGEYAPAGEDQGLSSTFSARQVADAFAVDIERVHTALQGEFALGSEATVDSKDAQHLAEVLLGDQPQDIRQAALTQLGAHTPRTDHDWGFGEKAAGQESDRLRRSADGATRNVARPSPALRSRNAISVLLCLPAGAFYNDAPANAL